jgi:benzoyl-CoA reductase/2-hydroxyglutaryl-CoA dehydratase subunit BcrC/BadD/HgdB
MRILREFQSIAENPKAQLESLLTGGKKVVGCMPYFCPEELVYAAGMTPFGIWGADIEVIESKRWFPAFICSILHTSLELGIRGEYDGLAAVMIPKLCDSLKCMGANWECAVPGIPVINVAHAQNRKMDAGVEFTASQYRAVIGTLAQLGGKTVSTSDICDAIELINKRRKAMRFFAQLASEHPEAVSPGARNDVIKSSYFMEAGLYTLLLQELCDTLAVLPNSEWVGARVVTTGIMADFPDFLDILEENSIMIAGDQVLHESISFREDVNFTTDPVIGLAKRIAAIEGASVLYDPGKQRAKDLLKLVRETDANGVIYLLTKFCDPEEYDYVPVKKLLEENDVPCLLVEVDRQMSGYEQSRTAIETFSELLQSR